MKRPLIVSPFNCYAFPSGGRTFAQNCQAILGGKILPLDQAFSDKEIYEGFDYTILASPMLSTRGITGEAEQWEDNICHFPHPIISRIDDYMDINEDFTWMNEIDFFLPLKRKFYDWAVGPGRDAFPILRKPVLLSSTPFLPMNCDAKWEEKQDLIFSYSRIDPRKRIEFLVENARWLYGKVYVLGDMIDSRSWQMYNDYFTDRCSVEDNVELITKPGGLTLEEASLTLRASKLAYAGTFWKSGGSLEYAALEAMDLGCLPIVSDYNSGEYRRENLEHVAFSNSWEFVFLVNMILGGPEEWFMDKIHHNFERLRQRADEFRLSIERLL